MFGIKKDRLKLILGEGSKIRGNVEAPGTILAEGTVTGNIHGEKVIIGEQAIIKGDLTAVFVIVGGHVEGNVKAEECVILKATSRLTGDIETKYLSVYEGAVFNGVSRMTRVVGEEAEVDLKVIEFTAKDKDRV